MRGNLLRRCGAGVGPLGGLGRCSHVGVEPCRGLGGATGGAWEVGGMCWVLGAGQAE